MSLLDKASLVMTPNAVKATKVYSVIPSNGNGDMTFSRGTPASGTRTNSNGVIENVAIDVPRLNYDTVGGCPSLLLEPQRTNLVTYSEDFSNNSWSKISTGASSPPTVLADNAISPNGTLSADTVNFGYSVSPDQSILNKVIVLPAGTYTFSAYIKSEQVGTIIILRLGSVSKLITLTNQYVRYTSTITTGVEASNEVGFKIQPFLETSSVAVIQVWGAQLEQGTYATTYIPTTTGTVTRVADTMTVSPPIGTVKITTTFSDDTTQIITTIPSTYTAPIGKIKLILMQHTL